jgi:hypothetical protein
MNRPRGWIQDSGSLENLIKVVELFDKNSSIYLDVLENQVRRKINDFPKQNQLLEVLQNRNGFNGNPLIDYNSLVGSRTGNTIVDSLVQVLLPGQNRLGIVDWACDNFIRFAYTLNFISFNEQNDSFTITEFGLELTQSNNDNTKFEIIKTAFKKYPPIVRVLELLFSQYENEPETPNLTKFEIGRELGFKGEDGFSTYSQNVFIQALNSAEAAPERNKIKQNWEGSSDKYARMICGWLSNNQIAWVNKTRKTVTIQIGNEHFTEILQSYQITISGINAFRSCRAYSRNTGTIKNVTFEMLATKGVDKDFLRIRRTYILQTISQPRSIEQIIHHLENNNVPNITIETVKDDIKNFKRIGLQINFSVNQFKLADCIALLEIPTNLRQIRINPSNLEHTKQQLREELTNLDHQYLDLLDFSIAGNTGARQFEVRIVELLNEIIIAKHLSGGNRPEIIAFNPIENPEDCIIMDSKAYREGFNIPANERDKMIRYVEEYNAKDNFLNNNRWWKNFESPNYPTKQVKFSFVSSSFIGQYINQLTYINNRTNVNGSAITAETLLRKVENVMNVNSNYNLNNFFEELGCNSLIE